MAQAKVSILSTRPVAEDWLAEAAAVGIAVDQLSFIETRPIRTIEVQQEIENVLLQSAIVVFTSMNAVEAVAEELQDQQPDWRIFCIGHATRLLVAQYFGEDAIEGTAISASALADVIGEEMGIDEVVFFCGDQRRDELPDRLKELGIEVHEIVVYKTLPQNHRISKEYQGILFFSPSAVMSFFRNNKLPVSTIVFAIGDTTGAAVKKYCSNQVLTAGEPGKENLFRYMLDYITGASKRQ